MTDIEKEKEIEKLEIQFPPASGVAFDTARQKVLDSGLSVLQSEDGLIYEVFPDGRRRVVKSVEPRIQMIVGSKFTLP